ncbi:ligase-associated DNA damage response DEXH box helicase [Actimicrobium antarcticum]|uniref:Ligase-associated DNA damage response DEXH box helicase n=1 Tax=Actimicrobium antarcticum TaxID=1051899 RepID=A0ABP7SWI5_9BURK
MTPQAWFKQRGWTIFPFQKAVWKAALQGRSGLLHATTGSGKTYAVWFAALARAIKQPAKPKRGLRVLWLTPMRALAADTARALQEPLAELLPDWTVGMRTGDTSAAERARQTRSLPSALVTTPESLCLMLSQANAAERFAALDMVIVDEWHELMGNKRGVQAQLALARLRQWHPDLVVWGLSATPGDLTEARDTLLGGADGEIVEGALRKELVIDTLIPVNPSRFAWSGHLGLQMLQPVIDAIEPHSSTLIFTNTRSQAELWYQNLLEARPDWAGLIALHHGSLDREVRDWVEQSLKLGTLKAVICTSSLDLGVDFLPVERVLQIGSAKGIARLLQRAGRSGHAPGRPSRITLVPTNSLELLEAAGAKRAVANRQIETRHAPNKPLDVLVQHLVTMALGGGFMADALFDEVRTAWSYRTLTRAEWDWALAFVTHGGQSLTVYPEYRRVQADALGIHRVPDLALGRRHRMGIGTIVADASIQVSFISGGRIGTVEESFISRMTPGDHFLFGGRLLELVRVHDMTALVKRASGKKAAVPRWNGGKLPLSSEYAHALLDCLQDASEQRYDGPEMQAIRPLLELQQRSSALPTRQRLVIETHLCKEGQHLFVYPFAGRSVHAGLAALLAYRAAAMSPMTFSISVNEYGFELLSAEAFDWPALMRRVDLFSDTDLIADVLASLNAGELAQRRFREIARIAGLVFQGYPGQPKSTRQLQASSSLFFEVFRKHDAGNLLLLQAQQEVLEQELELSRLQATLVELRDRELSFYQTERATPLGFPLMVERVRERLSSEKLSDRVARMIAQLEKAAGP